MSAAPLAYRTFKPRTANNFHGLVPDHRHLDSTNQKIGCACGEQASTELVPISALLGSWPGDPRLQDKLSTCLCRLGQVAMCAAQLVAKQNAGLKQTYFGRRLGSPPRLPGGGMTGILPVSGGVGTRISGSTPDGGHSTPSDLASLSPSGSWDWPTAESRSAFAPPDPIRSQLEGDCGGGGAVCCGGVAGVGGACAIAAADVTSNAQTIDSERFVCMQTQPRSEASVPKLRANVSGWRAPARLPERSGPFCPGTILSDAVGLWGTTPCCPTSDQGTDRLAKLQARDCA